MRQTASARSIAEACADRRRVGDGDVNLADVWRAAPTGGVRAAFARACAGSDDEAGPSYRTCTRSPRRRSGFTVPGLMSCR